MDKAIYVSNPEFLPYEPKKFWLNGNSLIETVEINARQKIARASDIALFSLRNLEKPDWSTSAKTPKPTAPKIKSLGAFTGSVTDPLMRNTVIKAEP